MTANHPPSICIALSDQTHLAAQDVPELGQLVETRDAEKPTKPCRAFSVGKRLTVSANKIAHRPELHQSKRNAAKPGSLQTKDHRRPHGRTHEHDDHEHHRREHHEAEKRRDEIEGAFHAMLLTLEEGKTIDVRICRGSPEILLRHTRIARVGTRWR